MQTLSLPVMRPLLWRGSHFNRHGFIEAALFLVLMQVLTNLGSAYFNLTLHPEKFIESTPADEQFGMFIVIASLLVAPWLENFIMLILAEIHELNFQRKGLFIVTPLIFAVLHVFQIRTFASTSMSNFSPATSPSTYFSSNTICTS